MKCFGPNEICYLGKDCRYYCLEDAMIDSILTGTPAFISNNRNSILERESQDGARPTMAHVRLPLVHMHTSQQLLRDADSQMMKHDADALIQRFLRKRGYLGPAFVTDASLLKKRKVPKRVRFADVNDVVMYDNSKRDMKESWYRRADYTRFSNDCRSVIKESDKLGGDVQKLNEMNYCIFGLEEQLVPSICYVKQKRKKALIQMIIREHELQKRLPGGPDYESIRALSVSFSRHSVHWARELGELGSHR